MSDNQRIIPISIEEEMKSAYIDYSMSVIVSRALPDVRDGLKPVHRRVLYGMSELGVMANRPYKKSARIVGEVLGKYHPHGDSSVYFAMVRMAQDWSLRYPLVDGQGNFGSVDGDSPAAMRYTEARLKRIAEEMLRDIDKETVDFQLNFDDTLQEPTVLPTRIPNLLVNGASGIAVGMATNMPPHNLRDVIEATVAYIDNREISMDELIDIVKAPDFPTGGIIYGVDGVRKAFETGKGRVIVRAKTEIETTASGRERIVVTEIPYMVNKAELIAKVAELVNDKKIEGIANANDESDRTGMRIVFDIKRDAVANVVLNKLFKLTAMQSTFSVNNIALVNGRPMLLNLKELIHYFVEHRHDVIVRRTKFELAKAEKDAHILEGKLIALQNIEEVIALIRGSKTPDEAREGLMSRFGLTEIQARAILDMRLQALTNLESSKLQAEYDELMRQIAYFNEVLVNEELRMKIIKEELVEINAKFGDERKTEIVYASEDFNPEDFYANEKVVVTISHLGYIKRTPLSEFRTQSRGGRGARGGDAREEDFLRYLFVADMHNTMLFFTENGKCYWQKVYELPEGSKTSKGRAIQNMINIEQEDNVKAFINVKSLNDEEYVKSHNIVMVTREGIVKKTTLEAYSRPRANGINAINVREGDILLEAKLTDGTNDILLASNTGKAVRFHESQVRPMGRTASGVKGINLSEGDRVIGMICLRDEESEILVVSEHGYGKRSLQDDYRKTSRGGKGVKAMNITDKTGLLIAIKSVTDRDHLMIINRSGIAIRLAVSELRTMGRTAQGVKLINIQKNDSIASVARVKNGADEDADLNDIDNENNENLNESSAEISAPDTQTEE